MRNYYKYLFIYLKFMTKFIKVFLSGLENPEILNRF